MSKNNDLVQVAIDTYKGKPMGNYSVEQSNAAIRNRLIELNGGKTYLDPRDIRDGKCSEVFAIIEEVVVKTAIEGLQGNEFFMNLAETKNLAAGDKAEFYTPDDSYFKVATIARGTQGIRRQRLNGGTSITVNTKTYGVKIYEHLDRVLSGRVNFTDMVTKVGESFAKAQYEDIYKAWTNLITASGSVYFPVAGSYDEAELLKLCEHVEANGSTPVLMGTRTALRKVTTSTVADSAKEDMYEMGYYGKFNGYNMVRIKQQHKVNTDEFIFPDDKIYVICSDTKPIKYVNEGQALIIAKTPEQNDDLTQEYFMSNRAGVAIVLPDKKMGVYTMS